MPINQRQFRNNIFETLLDIKAIDNGNEKTIGFCKETDMFYKWENDGSSFVPDDYFILTTEKGGDTRWIQITVSKEYIDLITKSFFMEFEEDDWILDPALTLKYMEIEHDLNTISPNVIVYENDKMVYLHEFQILNNNKVKVFITETEEFSGYLILTRL